MFTAAAFVALALIEWLSRLKERRERAIKPSFVDDDFLRERVLFVREDVRLIAYLMMAILLMLGVIADRLH